MDTVILPGQTVNMILAITGGQAPYAIKWLSNVAGSLVTDLTLNDILLHDDVRNGGAAEHYHFACD